MAERHRGNGRGYERNRPAGGSRGGGGPYRGPQGRSDREARGYGGFAPRGAREPREPRERPAPPPPAADDEYQDVDAGLAMAILETATRLTELVGSQGLPETQPERREAVLDTFDTIYFRILETVTGGDEDEEE